MDIPTNFIERVLSRCVEEGDCLLWTGAMNNGSSPVMWIGNKVVAVRRVMWVEMGKTLTPGRHVCAKCGNPTCIAPEHAYQKKRGMALGTKKTAAVRHRMAEARRRWASLTWDDVIAIRMSTDSASVLAERFDVSVDHIRRVRLGLHWNQELAGPFAGLMGART